MNLKKFVAFFVLVALAVFACNKDKKQESTHSDSINEGSATVLVDETLLPIVQDQVEIFESQYRAKIALKPKSETEAIQDLANGKVKIAILARNFNAQEQKVFQAKNINPRITKIATDAITLIANKNSKDTLIALQDVIDFMQQKPSRIKGLVFDNPNSSTAHYLNELAHIQSFPKEGVFSFKTNEEAIRYVSENDGMIGVVGLNWIEQPSPEIQPFVDKVNMLSVKPVNGSDYIFPSQNDIAEGKYPLARDLYFVNCQGYSGLGMGFASFIAGETGQRIILKSGLVPAKMPGRKILIRNGIEKSKK